jgi:arabinofuranan 3-O-arabinosyltransferase
LLVRQALRDSPGIERVAGFGPLFPGDLLLPGLIYDAGLGEPASAVEVYEVADPAPRAWTTPLSEAVVVAGGPDALLPLEDRGLLTNRPTVPAGAAPSGVGATMVSDALVRRERTFGRTTDAASAGLSAEDPLRLHAPARDYAVAFPERAESVVRYDGGVPSASSSASDPDGVRGTRPEAQPWAAIDGDPTTSWRPIDRLGEPQPVWWRLETDRKILLTDAITVVLSSDGALDPPDRVRITTDAGSISVALADTDEPQKLPVPTGHTDSLTIRSAPLPGGGDDPGLSLAEVRVPGSR